MMRDPSRQGFAVQFFSAGVHLLARMVNSQSGWSICMTAIHFSP